MAKKSGYVAFMDNLSFIMKLITTIPLLNILWAIYRIVKGLKGGNMLMLIVGILWIVPGAAFLWLVDMISVILYKKPVVFA